jgi:TraI-like middle domain
MSGWRLAGTIAGELRESKSWAELEHRLEQHGLRVEARGRGMVVTDGEREVKASRILRTASRGRLEERFGQRLEDWRRQRGELVAAVEALATHDDKRQALFDRQADAHQQMQRVKEAEARLREARREYDRWAAHAGGSAPSAGNRPRDARAALDAAPGPSARAEGGSGGDRDRPVRPQPHRAPGRPSGGAGGAAGAGDRKGRRSGAFPVAAERQIRSLAAVCLRLFVALAPSTGGRAAAGLYLTRFASSVF